MSHVRTLAALGLIDAPEFVTRDLQFEVVMGSTAFGTSDNQSDLDVYGFTIPPKTLIWPHLTGAIPGFDPPPEIFAQFQRHHIQGQNEVEFDVTIYSIVKFFFLALEGNPSLLDTLWVPKDCLSFVSPIGQMVLDNRELFLHKECWKRYRGYAEQMLRLIDVKKPEAGSRRRQIVEEFGYDTKFAAHAIRLVLEGVSILRDGALDLRANRVILKEVRSGQWSLDKVKQFVEDRNREGEEFYSSNRCAISDAPRFGEIKQLLIECLEMHFGSLTDIVPPIELGRLNHR